MMSWKKISLVLLILPLSYGGFMIAKDRQERHYYKQLNEDYKEAVMATQDFITNFQALSYEKQDALLKEKFAHPVVLDKFDTSVMNQRVLKAYIYKKLDEQTVDVSVIFLEPVSQQEEASIEFLVQKNHGQWHVINLGHFPEIKNN
jgi:hypothetical protein